MNNVEKTLFDYIFPKDSASKLEAKNSILSSAKNANIYPASTFSLYKAGRNNFTVPAINIRTLTFHTASMIFNLMKTQEIGPVIFEIARSELPYTHQDPEEYSICILAAAVNSDYVGPVFLQADHVQVRKKDFENNKELEMNNIKDLIKKYLDAGFYNIDFDASTLVDATLPTTDEQQKINAQVTAELTTFIATNNPTSSKLTIGAEIGHIGDKNSTINDLHSFMKIYKELVPNGGISKISIQTGSSHGGIPDEGGSVKPVEIDTNLISVLGEIAKNEYKLAGVVQHGASTLSSEIFSKIRDSHAIEIHLATGLQNIFFDEIPDGLKSEMYRWIMENEQNERKPEWNDQQFYYKLRKKALGVFKEKIWRINHDEINKIILKQANFLSEIFKNIGINNTKTVIEGLYEIH